LQFELIAPYQASPGQVAAVEKLVKTSSQKKNKLFRHNWKRQNFCHGKPNQQTPKANTYPCAQQDFGCSTLW